MGATHVPSHVSPSPMNNFRSQSITRYDVSPDDLPILRGDDTADENPDIGEQTPENIFEAVQSPAFSVKYSPASNRPTDTTKLEGSDVTHGPVLGNEPDKEPDVLEDEEVPTKDERNYIPSEVVDYYNEAAMKTKTRNALPDEVFGLPRTRQYPLNDKKHVMLAIKMFGHCKDPKDKQTLANNIFKAVEKFNLSPKIGKSNPLYDYAPKSLQEATSIPKLTIGGLETPMHKRTREDIIKEHMRKNGLYYNNMFYGPEFFQSVAKIPELSFLEFFYPNLTQMNFFTRLHCICGGLGLSDEVYEQIKMRKPLATDNSEIGWVTPEMLDDAWFVVDSTYSEKANWFGDSTATRNPDHIKYCLRLYSIMGKMLLDPTFDMSMLDDKQFAVLTDWEQHVRYHYGMYKGAENHDEEIREMQYMFDLFWNFNDNPDDYNVRTAMTIGLLNNMVSVTNFIPNMNETQNKSDEKLYRFTIDGIGVYEGFKRKVSLADWKKFLSTNAAKWLPVPPVYKDNKTKYNSYFRKAGYDKFKTGVIPEFRKYIPDIDKDIQVSEYNLDNINGTIAYSDKYQIVVNPDSNMNEASVKSELDKDFKPKEKIRLSSLKKVHITESIIDKYKKDYPDLRHVRCKDTKEYTCDGYMWFDKDKLVCHVGSCEYTDDHTKWIVSLEILPKYKGHGLSEQILDFAVKSMNCNYLSVAKTNNIAKHVYDKYGFKVYHEDDHMYYMQLKRGKMNEANVSGEIVSKEECSAYMVYEMGYSDDIFLLPITLEYPIIDQSSVRLAMDMINKIPEDQIQEYTTNLNRKYRELGCKFSISVDHPYAKYADKNIISNMTCVLLEGDTPVDDQGTSVDIKANQVDDPWYKRVDYTDAVGQNILDNKEMGPNTKPQQKPEYTEYDSFR